MVIEIIDSLASGFNETFSDLSYHIYLETLFKHLNLCNYSGYFWYHYVQFMLLFENQLQYKPHENQFNILKTMLMVITLALANFIFN